MKLKFTEWCSRCISAQFHDSRDIEDVEATIKVSILKPLKAKWITDLSNYFISKKGREIISNGWRVAFIIEALSSSSLGFKP